jgi:hypothetical protein
MSATTDHVGRSLRLRSGQALSDAFDFEFEFVFDFKTARTAFYRDKVGHQNLQVFVGQSQP